jgi:anti-sigma B factor antagonist
MALEIQPRIIEEVVILHLSGRLWVLDWGLHERMQSLLNEGRRFFVLDIGDVDYVDSTGLGQLITLWTSIRTKNGNLVLLRPTTRVRRLLQVTRLQVVFDAFDDEERARIAVRRDWE